MGRAKRWPQVEVPPTVDIGAAAAVTTLLQCELWFVERYQGTPAFPGSRAATAPFLVVIGIAFAWRRVRPMPSFVSVMFALAAMSLVAGGTEAGGVFLVLLVMCYSAVAYDDHPVVVVIVAAAAIVVHDLRDAHIHSIGDRFFSSLFLVTGVVLGRLMHRRVGRTDALTREAERLRNTADDQTRQAVTAERNRIARELHDVVAHSVSVMVVHALAARSVDEPQRLEALAVIESTGRQAMNEMRRLVSVLRDDDLAPHEPQPGLRQLEALVTESRSGGMEVTLAVRGDTSRVPPGIGLATYRIAQEALTNARKHAGLTDASVTVDCTDRSVEIQVRNAPGSGATLIQTGMGHGLVGMRERVSLYGGALHTGPASDGGYVVEASLPLEQP